MVKLLLVSVSSDLMLSKAAVASTQTIRAGIVSLTCHGREQESYFQEEK